MRRGAWWLWLGWLAACGGSGGDDGETDAPDAVADEAADGDDDGMDAGDEDGASPASPWPGAYDLTTWLEAYPRLPRGGTLPAAGDCFDGLADLLSDPTAELAARTIAMVEEAGRPVPAALRESMEASVESVLCGCHPDWCADPAAARSPFVGVAAGLPLTGLLTIDAGPDAAGVFAAGQLHEYAAVVLPQSLPCNGAASPACRPESIPLRELLGWSSFDAGGTWYGRGDAGGLMVEPHAMPLPVGRILRAAIERHLLGALLGDPTLDRWDAAFDAWLPRCVIRTYNAGVGADGRLAEDGGCATAGTAWAALVVPDDPVLAAVVAIAFAAVCDGRHAETAGCLATFDDVARDGVMFATAAPCPAPDDDGDGLVDGFGSAEPCPWTLTWRDPRGERTAGGRFTARRLGR